MGRCYSVHLHVSFLKSNALLSTNWPIWVTVASATIFPIFSSLTPVQPISPLEDLVSVVGGHGMPERVVIVGHSAITCLGRDMDATWEALVAGRSGLRRHETLLPKSLYQRDLAGVVEGFKPGVDPEWYGAARLAARSIHLALMASKDAWTDAGLAGADYDPHRVAVAIGSAFGGQDLLENEQAEAAKRGGTMVSPFLIPGLIINQAAGQVAEHFKVYGPSVAPANACASGGHGIALAAMFLRAGEADLAICGGTESALTPAIVNGFTAMRALASAKPGDRAAEDPGQSSRPFSIDRAGFVPSEGAGMLVLATESAARRLGLRIQAELLSWATNSDGHHMAIPHRDRIARCLALSVERAGIHPEQINYYNAHGTSTQVNDRVETEAIKQVYGDYARRLPVSSIKGALGHALGAASAIEAAVCVRALQRQVIPPTINYQPDPELDLDYVPNNARPARLDYIQTASFGFGGTNNALVFRRECP
jgi:3-oxoacyl-[acyl-carrier-protein] synthase II